MRNVVLLGKGDLAIRIAEWFHQSPAYNLRAVVPVIPEPRWAASLADWCAVQNVPVIASGDYKDLGEHLDGIDLAISVFYDKIIRAWFIARCGRILNLHNGPLPRYRGVSPINWALKNNEREHGVTLHEITPGIDDGPIVAQLKYSIYPEIDEVIDVYQRAQQFGWLLFEQTMPMLDRIKACPQDEAQALYYSKKQDHLLGERANFTRATSMGKH